MKFLGFIVAAFCFFTSVQADYFAKGADISWVPGQESRRIVFFDTLGVQRDIFDILKNDYQMNTIRLRVFVNPSTHWGNGLCDIPATVLMAQRAHQHGMRLMLTLHYSDSWADPGQQFKPAAWASFDVAQLEQAVTAHTTAVMVALRDVGITPEWVQIGNETNNGMLWDSNPAISGRATDNFANYARFVSAGHNAVKAISPNTKTVVHLSNGFDNELYRWNIGGLIQRGVNFDVIAMSAYPVHANLPWRENNNRIIANATDLIARFNKPVIVAEIGMDYWLEDDARDMIADLIVQLRALPNQMGQGVLYWEPQAGPGYNHYNMGAWGANGRPTRALTGFIEDRTTSVIAQSKTTDISEILAYPNPFTNFLSVKVLGEAERVTMFNFLGEIVFEGGAGDGFLSINTENFASGVYILKTDLGKKVEIFKP